MRGKEGERGSQTSPRSRPSVRSDRMSNGKGSLEKQLNGFGEKGTERSRTSLVISQAVNRSIFTSAVSPAAERIRFILGEEDDSPAPPQLFTELDELLAVDGQEMEWKETARWVAFPLPRKGRDPRGKCLFNIQPGYYPCYGIAWGTHRKEPVWFKLPFFSKGENWRICLSVPLKARNGVPGWFG